MVNKLLSPGLCISFNRVDKIQSAIMQNLYQQYHLKETNSVPGLIN